MKVLIISLAALRAYLHINEKIHYISDFVNIESNRLMKVLVEI